MEQRKPAEIPEQPSIRAAAGAADSTEVTDVIQGVRTKAGIPGAGVQDAAEFSTYMDIPWHVRDPSTVEPIDWLSQKAA